MSIVTYQDFKGEQNIPGMSNLATRENLNAFIEKYERKFLIALLGKTTYDEFMAGLVEEPIPSKWVELRDEMDLKQMIVYYVYYWYCIDKTSLTTTIGEQKPKAENSDNATSWDKIVKSWNEMVEMTRLFDLSTDVYPDYARPYWRHYPYWWYDCPVNEIYYYKNTLNI